MLEKIIPSNYVTGLFSGSKDYSTDNDASSYRRYSSDDSDAESSYPDSSSYYNHDGVSSDYNESGGRPSMSRNSSRLTGDYSDSGVDTDFDDEENDSEEDYDEDDDDYSGFDGVDDEDSFEPIRGLKLATSQTYKEFRRNFTTTDVPQTESLYKAYSCALSKDILYHGRMYVTGHYVCFISKIFNVTTNKLVIPFTKITKIEAKMMMNFIPNSIGIRTIDDSRYTFTSFTNRNRTMGFLRKLRNSRLIAESSTAGSSSPTGHVDGQGSSRGNDSTPARSPSRVRSSTLHSLSGDKTSTDSNQGSILQSFVNIANSGPDTILSAGNRLSNSQSQSPMADAKLKTPTKAGGPASKNGAAAPSVWPVDNLGPSEHAKTSLPKVDENEKVLATEIIEAPVGVVANIIFGKDTSWYKHFLLDVEGNKDLKDLPAFPELKDGSERSFEYVKPLSGPIGPKQTKCNSTEKIEKWDMDQYIEVITTTATPDVPSGSSFTTLTRAVLAWGDNNQTQIRLGTWLEWTGKTWLKGPIEKGAIDGQTSYCKSLVAELSRKVKGSTKTTEKGTEALRPAGTDVEKGEDTRRVDKKSSARKVNEAIKEWQQLCAILSGAVVVLLILLLIVWRRGSRHSATPSKEQQLELLRIQEELELWQWIDDRKGHTVTRRQTLSDANIAEAIALTEKKLANIKASLF